MSRLHHVAGHALRLLRCGEEYFPRLVAEIDAATESVYLETYIYAADGSGRMVADALQRAARRGVSVHLLLDGFGSAEFPQRWRAELQASGVQVLVFRPQISWLTLRRKRLRRLHRKLALVDGHVAFIGGINIIDDTSDGTDVPRLDYAVEVQGETVERIHASMRRLWVMVTWISFRKRHEHDKLRLLLPVATQDKVAFVFRDNLRHHNDIQQAYLNAIAGAQREIVIANAYFLPGRNFRLALMGAARRGVRVVLMLQGRMDHPLLHYATQFLYDELLGAGLEIHEYHASFMHAKVAVIDGSWSTVGSSNIDPFSLWLAREANLVIRDTGFAATLRASLQQEMERGGKLVQHSAWIRKGFWARLLPRISYVLVRMMSAVAGHAGERDAV
ncbi:MAG: cardiolipin synthase ClsB [Sideroxydans sp.]|nr:cardiolipin synthase ClsB [Sideroxydans sp.]